MKRFIPTLIFVLVLAALAVVPAFALDGNPPAGGIDLVFVGQLLQALTLAILPVLASAGVRFVLEKARVEKAKLTQEQQYALNIFTKTAVYAAEQMQLAGYIDNKLDYATARVQEWLIRNKLYMDAFEIRANIEAAVYTEFNSGFAIESE